MTGVFAIYLQHEYLHDQDTKVLNEHFDNYSVKSYLTLERSLKLELQRLQSLATVFSVSPSVSRTDFDHYATVIMAGDNAIQSLQWLPLVKDKDREYFERSIQAEGFDNFQIVSIVNGQFQVAKKADEYAVVNYIYPFENKKDVLGLDAYSLQFQKGNLIKAAETGKSVASLPIQLTQTPGVGPSVILSQPVYNTDGSLKGYVALLLRVDHFLSFIAKNAILESSLHYQIIDQDMPELPYLNLDKRVIDKQSASYRIHDFLLPLANRNWHFIIQVNLSELPEYEAHGKKGYSRQVIYGLLASLFFAVLMFIWLKSKEEKRLTQRNLREQQVGYEELFEQSSDAFYVLNCSGDIINVNSESIRTLGYTKDEVLQMNYSNIDQKYNVDNVFSLCQSIENTNKILFESKHKRKDGSVFPVEISARKCMLSNNCVISLFARDLTERLTYRELSLDNDVLQKAVEKYTAEFTEQKQAFETVFQKSADGIFITEGRHVVDCNEATFKIFGYNSKEEILRLPNRVFAPKYQPDGELSHRKGFRMLQICMEKGSHRYEWVNRRSNGKEFWTDVVLTRIEYYGRPVIHIAFRDISKQKRLQAEAIAAKEAAVKANEYKSEFIANISHEIRTPLHGILSYAQMGVTRVHSVGIDKLERYFNSIHISAQRLLLLLNDVLDSAKLESGLMRFDFEYQDIQDVVGACVEEQAGLAATKNIELVISGMALNAYFDRHRISQVLSNLLSNAIRFTPKDRKILIKFERFNEQYINISVTDEGPGIQRDELSKIFGQFIQSTDNLTHTVGTGLGLAICREITKAHNGEIWVENREDLGRPIGAAFIFTLPINREVWLANET